MNILIKHWELDDKDHPTQPIIEQRRRMEFIDLTPKLKKHKGSGNRLQLSDTEEDSWISSDDQRQTPTLTIKELYKNVDARHKLLHTNFERPYWWLASWMNEQ